MAHLIFSVTFNKSISERCKRVCFDSELAVLFSKLCAKNVKVVATIFLTPGVPHARGARVVHTRATTRRTRTPHTGHRAHTAHPAAAHTSLRELHPTP